MIKMDTLFRTSYYIAKNERPFTDFTELINLQCMNGLNFGETYHNDKAVAMFISHILVSGCLFDDLKHCLHQCL